MKRKVYLKEACETKYHNYNANLIVDMSICVAGFYILLNNFDLIEYF